MVKFVHEQGFTVCSTMSTIFFWQSLPANKRTFMYLEYTMYFLTFQFTCIITLITDIVAAKFLTGVFVNFRSLPTFPVSKAYEFICSYYYAQHVHIFLVTSNIFDIGLHVGQPCPEVFLGDLALFAHHTYC